MPIERAPSEFLHTIEVQKGRMRSIPYHYVTTDAQVPDMVAWCRTQRVLGYDTETSGLDALVDRVATMQFGSPLGDDPRVYVVCVRSISTHALQPLLDVLRDPAIVKLGQNLKFEYKFTKSNFKAELRGLHDVQLSEMVLRAGLFGAKKARDTGGKKQKAGDKAKYAAYKYTSMAALAARYLDLDIDKDHDLRTSFWKTPAGSLSLRQVIYAGGDVVYPFYIAQAQRDEIEARNLRPTLKVEYAVIPVLGNMELRGLQIDTLQWARLWQRAVKELAVAQQTLDDLLVGTREQQDLFDTTTKRARPLYPKRNKELNYDSPEQVKWVIREYCRQIKWPVKLVMTLPEWRRLKEQWGGEWLQRQAERGREVTADDIPDRVVPEDQYMLLLKADADTLTLGMCRKQLPVDLVKGLLEYSHWSIRATSFGQDFVKKHVNPTTGRLHAEVHQAITNTGRLSTSPNTQNLPREHEYRRCFVPAPNYVFVIADYASQEPRLTAQVSKDPTYVNCFLGPKPDLYLDIAELALGERPDKKTEEGARQRQNFKITGLSKAYRAGVAKLRDQLTLWNADQILDGTYPLPTWEFAYDLNQRFVDATPGLLEWQEHMSSTADPANKHAPRVWDGFLGDFVTYATSPCGRKRFFAPEATGTFTEGPNFPIQGGSATMTKAAAVLVQREIDARGWNDQAWIVNMVHDEIVAEVHEDIAEEFARMMKEMMERAGRFYCPDIPIVAEYPEGSDGRVPYWTKELHA